MGGKNANLFHLKENFQVISKTKRKKECVRCFDLWQVATVSSNLFFSIFCSPHDSRHVLIFLNKCWRGKKSCRIMYHPDIYFFLSLPRSQRQKKQLPVQKKNLFSADGNVTFKCIIFIILYIGFQLHLAVRSAHKVHFKWCWLQNWLNVFVKVKIVYCIRRLATIVMTVAPLILMNYMLVRLFMALEMVRVTVVVQRWRIKQELKNHRKVFLLAVLCFLHSFLLFCFVFKLCWKDQRLAFNSFQSARSLLLKATHGVDTKHTQRPPQQENHTLGPEWLICKCIKDLAGRKLELWCTVIYPVALNRSQTQSGCICCKWCRVVFWFVSAVC